MVVGSRDSGGAYGRRLVVVLPKAGVARGPGGKGMALENNHERLSISQDTHTCTFRVKIASFRSTYRTEPARLQVDRAPRSSTRARVECTVMPGP